MSKREVIKSMREALEAEGVKVVDFPISDELRGAQPSFVVVDDEDEDDVSGEAAKDDGIAVIGCDYGREVTVMIYAARMVGPRTMELVYGPERPVSAYRSGDAIIVDECHIALDWSEHVAEMKKPPRLRLDGGRKAWQTCHGPAPRKSNVFGDCRKR